MPSPTARSDGMGSGSASAMVLVVGDCAARTADASTERTRATSSVAFRAQAGDEQPPSLDAPEGGHVDQLLQLAVEVARLQVTEQPATESVFERQQGVRIRHARRQHADDQRVDCRLGRYARNQLNRKRHVGPQN